eukprot:scaffold40574_cov27-Tisochrysis_lutea.AAC.8
MSRQRSYVSPVQALLSPRRPRAAQHMSLPQTIHSREGRTSTLPQTASPCEHSPAQRYRAPCVSRRVEMDWEKADWPPSDPSADRHAIAQSRVPSCDEEAK